MSKWNNGIQITFNDNDGKAGWSADPAAMQDLIRHWRLFGIWRTRWILFKKFWIALQWLELYCDNTSLIRKQNRKWIFKSEIPE